MCNRRFILNFVCGFTILVLGSGCAELNSIHRELDLNEGKGVLIDIKQRAIIVKKMKVDGETIPIVCAEPSPDALSAFASVLSGKVDIIGKFNVGADNKIQENASFVGLRTQSIQLLRDFLYRDCEAYMNGVINKYQYDVLMRRNQKYMVALLGIEQLTGAVTAKPSTWITEMSPDNVAGGAGTGTNNSTQNNSGTKTWANPGATSQQSKKQYSKINNFDSASSVVNNIVSQILQTDDIGQSCFAYIAGGSPPPNPKLGNICTDYLEKVSKKAAESNNVYSECLSVISNASASGSKPDELIKLMDALKKSGLCNAPENIMRSTP